MSEPGEMTVIAQIAAVDMAVITNVGVTHIENLGTRENILREKLKIQDGMRADGPVFLNGDNDLLGISRAREERMPTTGQWTSGWSGAARLLPWFTVSAAFPSPSLLWESTMF